MTADRILAAFRQAATQLKFEFEAGFVATLLDGSIVQSIGRLPHFGAARGTLIFAEQASPSSATLRALDEMGYFSSVPFSSYERFAERHFAETLDDRGFFGPSSEQPAWYTGKSWGATA